MAMLGDATVSPGSRRSTPFLAFRRAVASHPDAAAIVLLVVASAVVRLLFFPRAPVFLHGDSYQYFRPAEALLAGDGFPLPLKRPPVYPVFMALVGWGLGPDLRNLAAVQHALGVGTAILTYGVGRLVFGRGVGVVAGLAAGLSGGLLIYEHYVLTEAVFTFLLVLAVFFYALGLRRASGWYLAGSGLAIALATLTRPHAQVLLVLAPAAAVLCYRRWCPGLRGTLVAVAVAMLVLLPWMARNRVVHGVFTVAGSSGQPLIDLTANHHAGKFVFYDSDNPPDDDDPRLERARRFIQRRADDKVRNPSSSVMGITIQGWIMREFDLDQAASDALMRQVALDAIRARPLTYAQVVVGDTWRILQGRPDTLDAHWNGHHRMLTDRDNPPPRGLRPLMRPASPEQEAGFGETEWLVNLYQAPRLGPVVPILFMIGLVCSAVIPGARLGLIPALTVLALHAGSAATVGAVGRYHHPPDPLMHVVAAGGALWLLRLVGPLARRAVPRPVPSRATVP